MNGLCLCFFNVDLLSTCSLRFSYLQKNQDLLILITDLCLQFVKVRRENFQFNGACVQKYRDHGKVVSENHKDFIFK